MEKKVTEIKQSKELFSQKLIRAEKEDMRNLVQTARLNVLTAKGKLDSAYKLLIYLEKKLNDN